MWELKGPPAVMSPRDALAALRERVRWNPADLSSSQNYPLGSEVPELSRPDAIEGRAIELATHPVPERGVNDLSEGEIELASEGPHPLWPTSVRGEGLTTKTAAEVKAEPESQGGGKDWSPRGMTLEQKVAALTPYCERLTPDEAAQTAEKSLLDVVDLVTEDAEPVTPVTAPSPVGRIQTRSVTRARNRKSQKGAPRTEEISLVELPDEESSLTQSRKGQTGEDSRVGNHPGREDSHLTAAAPTPSAARSSSTRKYLVLQLDEASGQCTSATAEAEGRIRKSPAGKETTASEGTVGNPPGKSSTAAAGSASAVTSDPLPLGKIPPGMQRVPLPPIPRSKPLPPEGKSAAARSSPPTAVPDGRKPVTSLAEAEKESRCRYEELLDALDFPSANKGNRSKKRKYFLVPREDFLGPRRLSGPLREPWDQ